MYFFFTLDKRLVNYGDILVYQGLVSILILTFKNTNANECA